MQIERLRPECLSCLAGRYLEKYPENATEEEKLTYMRRVLRLLLEAPVTDASPVIVRRINDIRREMFGLTDEYAEVKQYFNQVMLGYEENISQKIADAPDPLLSALQYAAAGNYIDFGAMKNVEEERLSQLLNEADYITFPQATCAALREDLSAAARLVFLTDNCGEIVMDKLLIQTILRLYPQLEVTVVVKGRPVLNDATMEDAVQIGLPDLVKVIGNGSQIAGTWIPNLSEEAATALESADIILSKGQANYETLRLCGKNIYYLFLCKCDMFAREFGIPRLTAVLIREKMLTARKTLQSS